MVRCTNPRAIGPKHISSDIKQKRSEQHIQVYFCFVETCRHTIGRRTDGPEAQRPRGSVTRQGQGLRDPEAQVQRLSGTTNVFEDPRFFYFFLFFYLSRVRARFSGQRLSFVTHPSMRLRGAEKATTRTPRRRKEVGHIDAAPRG